jgi:hypothetical protein
LSSSSSSSRGGGGGGGDSSGPEYYYYYGHSNAARKWRMFLECIDAIRDKLREYVRERE